MKHLKPMKAAGLYGDRYGHYKAMPQPFVHDLTQVALNGELSESARFQCGNVECCMQVISSGRQRRATMQLGQ